MNGSVSIRQVAAQAGVSVGTVSNVLNRPSLVSAATRDRVYASIKGLGFVRNESARQLRAGRSRVIGLIVLDVSNPFFTDMASGAEDEAGNADLAVILCNSNDQLSRESNYLDLLEEHRVRGILITPVGDNWRRLAELQARGTPVVLVDSLSPSGHHCAVAVDDVLGGDLAVSHLLREGHERIAFAGGPPDLRQVSQRRDGAVRAIARAGGSLSDLVLIDTPALNVASGQAAAAAIADIAPPDRPTGVFAANDLVAFGLLREMTQRKIKVPADVAIVGYDDIDIAAAAAVPLSSVRRPRQVIGSTAVQLLEEEALRPDAHKHRQVIFAPELETRASSLGRPRARRHRSTSRKEAVVVSGTPRGDGPGGLRRAGSGVAVTSIAAVPPAAAASGGGA